IHIRKNYNLLALIVPGIEDLTRWRDLVYGVVMQQYVGSTVAIVSGAKTQNSSVQLVDAARSRQIRGRRYRSRRIRLHTWNLTIKLDDDGYGSAPKF
ncbi:MAG TPA: hypothetical protein ACFE0H_07640, partial [Elainellaceae cyanobacterium]